MQKLTVLNTREVKKIKKIIEENYGGFFRKEYAYLYSEKKNRLYLVNRDIAGIDTEKLIVDKIGLYFAEYKNGNVRLSKEGAQLLFLENGKKLGNTVELNEKEIKDYFLGADLEKDLGREAKFVLLKYKDDVFGCAKYKEGKILNFLPKIHRGEVIV